MIFLKPYSPFQSQHHVPSADLVSAGWGISRYFHFSCKAATAETDAHRWRPRSPTLPPAAADPCPATSVHPKQMWRWTYRCSIYLSIHLSVCLSVLEVVYTKHVICVLHICWQLLSQIGGAHAHNSFSSLKRLSGFPAWKHFNFLLLLLFS